MKKGFMRAAVAVGVGPVFVLVAVAPSSQGEKLQKGK